MKILLLGATGRTGTHVLRLAKAAGHHVTAHGRRPADGADAQIGGPWSGPELTAAAREADAVLSCLASSNSDPVCSTATAALLRATPEMRYLTIAGAGVDMPGDEKGIGDKAIGLVMKIVARGMLADRQREAEMLQASTARWTILRPPRLLDAGGTGRWRFTFDRPAATSIARADLAGAMLAAMADPGLERKAPFVSKEP